MTSEEKVKQYYPNAFSLFGTVHESINGKVIARRSKPRGNLSANERAWDAAWKHIEDQRTATK